jgi:hypothetical protein
MKLQDQSHLNEQLRSDIFKRNLEIEDLRQRLQYMEILTGRDSSEISSNVTQDSSKVDWARLLLDHNTDDMIITVSREKIAHEIIKLRNENRTLRSSATTDS